MHIDVCAIQTDMVDMIQVSMIYIQYIGYIRLVVMRTRLEQGCACHFGRPSGQHPGPPTYLSADR